MHSGLKRMTLTKVKISSKLNKSRGHTISQVQRASWLEPGTKLFTSKELGSISMCLLICPRFYLHLRAAVEDRGSSKTVYLCAEVLTLQVEEGALLDSRGMVAAS